MIIVKMNTLYKLSIALLLFTVAFDMLQAQPIQSYKREDMYAVADEQVQLGDYLNALEWYRKIYSEEKSEDVAFSIGYTF